MIFRDAPNQGRPGSVRPAYSLIEMLVVISVTVVLLSMMYRAIVGVMKRASDPDTALVRFESVSIGSQRLRQDLRISESFRIGDDGQSVETSSKSGSGPQWRIADRPFRLERREPGETQPSIFGLTGFRSGRFERFEIPSGSGPMVRLTLEPERSRRMNAGLSTDDRPFTIEFAVGTSVVSRKAADADAKGGKP